ncbi:hypothetical protein F4824DRAFT_494468 [Ustulina deusta]|nr:hypothetical protein F4824DRAFT_494468 [Ustulina deusta]
MSENRTRSQQLRDRFYVNFSNYRQGISWICGRIKLPKALQALERKEAGSLHAMKMKLDSIKEISELKEARNSIKNPYMDLQRRKAYITSKKDGKPSRSSIYPPQNRENYYTYGTHITTGAYDHQDNNPELPSSQSSSGGPPGTLGTGPDNPPTAIVCPRGIRINPPSGEAPLNLAAPPPPRDPEPPSGAFENVGKQRYCAESMGTRRIPGSW